MTFHVPSNSSTLTLQVTKLSSPVGGKEESVGECWVNISKFQTDETKTFYAHLWNSEIQPQPTSKRMELELCITKKAIQRACPIKKRLLFKYGDDIRQEHFCLSIFQRMVAILRANGLDLSLRTFQCILPPCRDRQSSSAGLIEWVDECVPMSNLVSGLDGTSTAIDLVSVLTRNYWYYTRNESKNPIMSLFRDSNYDPDEPYFVSKTVMDNYSKSCAGYCMLTYLLGVGDRHRDNLLIHPDGYFFHCDFSFLFGRDPKTYIPMRITEEMVLAMGGKDSDYFSKFLSWIGAAFLTFRRPANVRMLLNSILLVKDANLPDVSVHRTAEEALAGVKARLKLELSEDNALAYIESLVEECMSNKMWIAVDTLHSIGKRL